MVACDSTRPGHDDGELAPETLVWLDNELERDRSTPTIVAMHHPPVTIGIDWLDELGLQHEGRSGLADVLRRHPQAMRVVSGHVHMAIQGQIGSVPVITGPSTWRVRPRFALGGADLGVTSGPAELLVHALVDGQLITYVQPVTR